MIRHITAAAAVLMTCVLAATSQDATQGKTTFEKRCSGCHSLDREKEGPRLAGVFGRKAGTVASFKYSDALAKSGITWDEKSLDKWITDPDKLVPGNDMTFGLQSASERADIIAFLKQSAAK